MNYVDLYFGGSRLKHKKNKQCESTLYVHPPRWALYSILRVYLCFYANVQGKLKTQGLAKVEVMEGFNVNSLKVKLMWETFTSNNHELKKKIKFQ